MAAGDIGAILNKMTSKPEYISQEVIYGGSSEPITPEEYTTNGGVQEFRFTYALKSAFLGSGIAGLPQQVPGDGWLASEIANVFVANHDTERVRAKLLLRPLVLTLVATPAWPNELDVQGRRQHVHSSPRLYARIPIWCSNRTVGVRVRQL